MPMSPVPSRTLSAQSLKTLTDAEQLVEDAVYDLADKVDSETVSRLVVIAAEIKQVMLEVEREANRVH